MKTSKFRYGLKAQSIISVVSLIVLVLYSLPIQAGDPHSAYYSSDNNKIFWFIHISDLHIGASLGDPQLPESDNLALRGVAFARRPRRVIRHPPLSHRPALRGWEVVRATLWGGCSLRVRRSA